MRPALLALCCTLLACGPAFTDAPNELLERGDAFGDDPPHVDAGDDVGAVDDGDPPSVDATTDVLDPPPHADAGDASAVLEHDAGRDGAGEVLDAADEPPPAACSQNVCHGCGAAQSKCCRTDGTCGCVYAGTAVCN
jgi:hypothetical protein